MPLIHCDYHSNVLSMASSMTVILPRRPEGGDRPHRTLWLLHGWSDDHTIWQRRTSVETAAGRDSSESRICKKRT